LKTLYRLSLGQASRIICGNICIRRVGRAVRRAAREPLESRYLDAVGLGDPWREGFVELLADLQKGRVGESTSENGAFRERAVRAAREPSESRQRAVIQSR
jgi:hypothetical protein